MASIMTGKPLQGNVGEILAKEVMDPKSPAVRKM